MPQAVGIVRLSGPQAFEIAKKITNELPQPGGFLFRTIIDPETGNQLDRGLVLCFKEPHSFTGEDVVEFQLHGSTPVLNRLVESLVSFGARVAVPGEFSFRAFLNGKAKLSELELANALTKSQFGGKAIGKKIEKIRQELLSLSALVEACISFPEDTNVTDVQVGQAIVGLLSTVSRFMILCGKPGLSNIVIAGPPNAGKSTLFNCMVGFGRMVVSEIPGTTRDFVVCEADVLGTKVGLADGPGLDSASIDSGQRLLKEMVAAADVVLWLDPQGLAQDFPSNAILVQSKSDEANEKKDGWLQVSVKNSIGLNGLFKEIVARLPKPEYLVTPRQLEKIVEIKRNLEFAASSQTLDIAAFEIQSALRSLSMLDGVGLQQETLKEIFSTFCIGK